MNIALGVSCLVAVAVLVGVTGKPEQHIETENHDLYESRVGIQVRYGACKRGLGGKCRNRKRKCPGRYPLETKPGKPYCNKRRRCCYPASSKVKHLDDLSTHELWLHILLQMDRPYEDRFTLRGDKNYVYILENEIFKPDNRGATTISIPLMNEFTSGKGDFLNYTKGRDNVPSMFQPDVKKAVAELYAVYSNHPGAKGILKVAVNAQRHVNEYLHMFTLLHAIVYDKELSGFGLPAFYEVIPEFFVKEGCTKVPSHGCCQTEEYPHDLSDDEWKLSYWREDAGFNNFHGSWHYYNPHSGFKTGDKDDTLNHGELFYYFHNQLVARYDMERLSNGLSPVKTLDNWSSSNLIPGNYNPPILTKSLTRCGGVSAGYLGARLTPYRTNLTEDISNKKLMLLDGSYVGIANDNGIKYVGCALEAANCGDLDYKRYAGPVNYTWGIHNNGHAIISSMGCSKNLETKGPWGVMGSKWAAARDPIFFRWHKFNDDIFQLHKSTLPPYNRSQLALDHVSVSRIGVYPPYYDYLSNTRSYEGQLVTFNHRLKMTMWFNGTEDTCIYQPASNHHPFTYNINVNNDARDMDVNVRIFMAPKSTAAVTYEDLRTQWALMDRFKYKLTNGTNVITRHSWKSSITVPQPKTIQELKNIYKDEKAFKEYRYNFDGPFDKIWTGKQCLGSKDGYKGKQTLAQCMSHCLSVPSDGCTAINYNPDTSDCNLIHCTLPVPKPVDIAAGFQGYARITKPAACACGLPEHLLLPRGTEEGMPYQLFVYITPRKEEQSSSTDCPNLECSDLCATDYTGCDHSNGEVMGFPFDRPLTKLGQENITHIEDLVKNLPNAALHDITITYEKNRGHW